MDAVKFLKEKNRMCNKYKNCFECPVGTKTGGCQTGIVREQEMTEEELVSIVEKWSDEHPEKTRQSEFMKMFPDADLDKFGVINICPDSADKTHHKDDFCFSSDCHECRKDFWLADVE